jgi:hypothetical protein
MSLNVKIAFESLKSIYWLYKITLVIHESVICVWYICTQDVDSFLREKYLFLTFFVSFYIFSYVFSIELVFQTVISKFYMNYT